MESKEKKIITFYIWTSHRLEEKKGSYYLLLKSKKYEKLIEKHNIESNSATQLILLAVIDGLERLKYISDVMVYSNTLFGISSIYDKHGNLREKCITRYNLEEKETIRKIIADKGHILQNQDTIIAKKKIFEYRDKLIEQKNNEKFSI